ncbi:hypothetical protein MP228_010485 [Amoeboaphelidium protococcarum]|nr:hypothetical protein MP228_010485 [Amoeboaphelidium protococcarum]
MHPFLQLKTVDDYLFFMHKDLDYDKDLLINALQWCGIFGEPRVDAWSKAIKIRFQSDDRYVPQDKFKAAEWQRIYAPDIYKKNLDLDQPLAISQNDFLITVFRQYAFNELNLVNSGLDDGRKSAPPLRFWRYGYVYDALQKFGLQALVLVYNDYYNHRTNVSVDHQEFIQTGVFESMCDHFRLGDCMSVLSRLANLMEVDPSFSVLEAHYCISKEMGLSDQLDRSSYFKEGLTRIIQHYQCTSTASLSVVQDNYIPEESLEMSSQLEEYLVQYISYDWMCDYFQQFDSTPSTESAWIMAELLAVYKMKNCRVLLLQKVVDKISRGVIDEVCYLLTAITSFRSSLDGCWGMFDSDLFKENIDAVIEVVIKLGHNWQVARLFENVLGNQKLLVISRFIHAFVNARDGRINDASNIYRFKGIFNTIDVWSWHNGEVFNYCLQSLSAVMLQIYHEHSLGFILRSFSCKYQEQVCQLIVKLLSFYKDSGDLQRTASFLNAYVLSFLRDDKLQKIVTSLHSYEQLRYISTYLKIDVIEALKLGTEYQLSWIQEIKLVASDLQFPDNLIQFVRIVNANCGSFADTPELVRDLLLQLITSTIALPLEQRKSRFYFFDGLPYYVFKEEVILQNFPIVWDDTRIIPDRSLVPPELEFVRGYLSYVHSDNVPERDREQLVCRLLADARSRFVWTEGDVIDILVKDHGYPSSLSTDDFDY